MMMIVAHYLTNVNNRDIKLLYMTREYERQRRRGTALPSDPVDRNAKNVEDRFVVLAKSLEIPLDEWGDVSVQQFLGLVERAHQLHAVLATSAQQVPAEDTSHDLRRRGWDVRKRCERSELLLRAVIHILEEGFNGRQVGPDYVANKVGHALAPYGIRILAPVGHARPRERSSRRRQRHPPAY